VVVQRIKYGVVRMKDLAMDALTWDRFYLSGRLQKPVCQRNALFFGLLCLGKDFFYFFSVDVQSHCATLLTICSCTYGDFNVLCGSAILHALSDSYSLHFKFLLTNSLFVSLFKIVYYLTV
jgi:hypothetical protein